jgi:predicted nucleotidyltransferase
MNKEELKQKLLQAIMQDKHSADIKSVAIFGSYVNGTPSEDSDIDVLINFEPDAVIGFFALSDIKDNFESILKKSVDLLTPQAISKYFRSSLGTRLCQYQGYTKTE